MKPYTLVLHNKVKFALLLLITNDFKVNGIQMFSKNLKLKLNRSSHVLFEDRIISDGRMVIIVDKNAKLSIGKKVYFNEDAMISCKGSIAIGAGCKFGPNVKIFDNNHKFDAENGVSDMHSVGTIEIGDNCWIGTNVVILKGSKIGRNCVIGAGCVISGDIPESSIVTQGRECVITKMK